LTEHGIGGNTISVTDVRAMKKVDAIDLGRFHRPHGIAFVPGSARLVAATERPFGLVMVDAAAQRLVRDYDVKGKSPHMVIPARDGRTVFVSDTDSDAVAAIDLNSGDVKLIPTIKHAGARPNDRDEIDRRIIREFQQRLGHFIDSQDEVGGYPKVAPVKRGFEIPADVESWLAKLAAEVER
jgi:hypothetical protein